VTTVALVHSLLGILAGLIVIYVLITRSHRLDALVVLVSVFALIFWISYETGLLR